MFIVTMVTMIVMSQMLLFVVEWVQHFSMCDVLLRFLSYLVTTLFNHRAQVEDQYKMTVS